MMIKAFGHTIEFPFQSDANAIEHLIKEQNAEVRYNGEA